MRIVTTAILGGTAVVLAVVIWLIDRESEIGGDAQQSNVLVRFVPELVDRIVVEKGPSKTVMENRDGVWIFAEPIQDRVDAGAVAVLLDQLNHLGIADQIQKNEEGLSPQEVGLKGDQAIKITVGGLEEEGGDERFKKGVILGEPTPRSDSLYAKRVGEGEATFVVDGNPREWLEDPLANMRDRRILGVPVEAIVQMVVRTSKGEVALQRKITPPVQDWAIVEPMQTWASRDTMDSMLASLAGLRIEEVIRDASQDEKIPNPLPDNAAVFQIVVFGSSQPITVYLKQAESEDNAAPPLLEARVSGRPAVYRFHSNFLSQIPETANDYRDRTLARIPIDFLDAIVIQSRVDPLVHLVSERSENAVDWFVKLNDKLLPANMAEVSNLISSINDTAILDFASDSGENLSDFGLSPPARRIVLSFKFPGQPDEQGNPGQVQEVNRILNLGWKEGDVQRLFANFDGEDFVYELDPSFVSTIPTHPVKWRSLSVLTFNSFHLKSITREIEGQGVLKLDYDYTRDSWEATRNGVDVSPTLDITAARKLRDRLGSLTATGWYLSLGQALEALQEPSAVFTIVTTELDPATGDRQEVSRGVRFAKSIDNVYYGRIDGSPDVFLLDSKTYGDLIRPVTGSRLQ